MLIRQKNDTIFKSISFSSNSDNAGVVSYDITIPEGGRAIHKICFWFSVLHVDDAVTAIELYDGASGLIEDLGKYWIWEGSLASTIHLEGQSVAMPADYVIRVKAQKGGGCSVSPSLEIKYYLGSLI